MTISDTALVTLLLLVVAATFWRPLRRVRASLGIDYLGSTGHTFLIVGFLLGLALEGQTAALTHDLSPIITFVAGWIGFATGMRFELRVLRTVPQTAYAVALLPAVMAAAVVGLASFSILVLADFDSDRALGAALIMAAAAASSGPTLAAILRTRRPGRTARTRAMLRMIEFSAGMSDAVVVVLAVLAFALFQLVPEPVPPAWQLLATAGGGALLGMITWLLLGGRASEDERLLLGLAMLAFTAGFAGWLLVSPSAVAAIAAVVLANLPGNRVLQLFEAVRRVERPAVVILMLVIGFQLAGPLGWSTGWIVAPLVLAMTLVRLATRHTAGSFVEGPIPGAPGLAAYRGWTHGLMAQSTLGLMVALSYFQVWGDEMARAVLAAVAIGSLVNDLLAPVLLARALRHALPAPAHAPGEPSGDAAGKEAPR